MTRRRPLATLLASLVLHGGVLLAVLVFVQRESELGTLFIDLTEWAAAGSGGGDGTAAAPPPAARPAPASAAVSPPRPLQPEPAAPAPAAVAAARPVESASSPAAAAAAPAPARPPTPRTAEPHRADATITGAAGAASPDPGGADGALVQDGRGGRAGARGGAPSALGARGGGVGGAPDVSHGFALATPGSGAGGPAAEYGPYLGRLRQRIQGSLRYPLAARRRGLAGTVNLEIVIRPDGAFSVVAVADSSSHPILDDAALQTVKSLVPEPFPSDVPPRNLRVRLPVVFALE
ncbi:MAG: energy transducer TonB [Actinobacteria bacterium]|nr:energy transducer TonB [Actinomycetota bacterium]